MIRSAEAKARKQAKRRDKYRTDPEYRLRYINHNRFQKDLPPLASLDGVRLNVPLKGKQ